MCSSIAIVGLASTRHPAVPFVQQRRFSDLIGRRPRRIVLATGLLAALAGATAPAASAQASCLAPANEIVAENCLPGSPAAEWDVPGRGSGDASIQGFATR